MSLARQHRQKIEAACAAAQPAAAVASGPNHTYRLLQLKLAEDRRLLKSIESIARKIDTKRSLLPYYDHWITAVLEHGTGDADPVLMTLLLWHLDTGSYATALRIARYALRHGLSMPEGHSRKVPCVIAEEIADHASTQQAAGLPIDVDALQETLALTADQDMPDQVRAKLHKALAQELESTDLPRALTHYQRALEYNPRCGVKTQYARLRKQLASASSPARPDGAAPEASLTAETGCPPSDYPPSGD